MKNESIDKLKRILAMSTIIVILALYAVTFILAIMNNSYTDKFFNASLFATVFVPVMTYLIIWMTKLFRNSDEAVPEANTSDKNNLNSDNDINHLN